MKNEFYDRYQAYSKEEIFEILKDKENYQQKSVEAATLILKEQDWEPELLEIIHKENEIYQTEIAVKAAYYQNVVEFKNDGNSFEIKTCDIPRFESSLITSNIKFFREEKHMGAHLDKFPTERYYFKDKDVKAVDEICIALELVTAPYADIKPFFKFELKTLVITLAILAALTLILFY